MSEQISPLSSAAGLPLLLAEHNRLLDEVERLNKENEQMKSLLNSVALSYKDHIITSDVIGFGLDVQKILCDARVI